VQINAKTGEYQQEGAAKAMDRRELVGDVVEHYQRLAGGRRGVVFAASVEHSQHVAEAFMAAGIRAEHLDGETDSDVRDAMLAKLRRGDITIVCNYGVLTEGWDEPGVGYVAIARPTKSLSLYLQMAGRGLRPAAGKADALLVDHAGVVHQHGLPQDDREWSLEGRVKRKGAVAVRTCPQCYAALPGGTMVCTECGHVFVAEARDASELEQVDGELVEASAKPKPTMDERAAFYEKKLIEGVQRGSPVGWCRHRYRDAYGIWPAGGRLKALERTHYPAAPPVEMPAPVEVPEAPFDLVEPAPAPRRARRIDLDALLAPPPVVQAPAIEAWTL
jgi:hypothetical protein